MENIKKFAPENNNNIEEIPLKGGANFNDILEKELLKDKNNEYDNNENKKVEPKFKYVPKKNKRDIVSAPPTNTKKYKYYSDNFKAKKKKKENQNNKNQIENINENEIQKEDIFNKNINENIDEIRNQKEDNFKKDLYNNNYKEEKPNKTNEKFNALKNEDIKIGNDYINPNKIQREDIHNFNNFNFKNNQNEDYININSNNFNLNKKRNEEFINKNSDVNISYSELEEPELKSSALEKFRYAIRKIMHKKNTKEWSEFIKTYEI